VRFDVGSLPGFRPAEGPWASLRRVPGTTVVHLELDTAERPLPASRLLRVELEAGRQTCPPDWAMRLLMCADDGEKDFRSFLRLWCGLWLGVCLHATANFMICFSHPRAPKFSSD
jgi:hypothetical protein